MKRIISLIMSIVLVMSLFCGTTFNVSAAGDSIDTATKISLNTNYKGSITEYSDQNVYKFTLDSSGSVKISLTAYVEESRYYIYDENGNDVWHREWNYWNEIKKEYKMNETVDLVKGTYYFAVVKYDDEYTGKYNFKLEYKSAKESIAESQSHTNNSVAEADSIKVNKTYKGQLATNDDTDLYKFALSSSGRIKIKISAYINYSSYYLYDENGNSIWVMDWKEWNENTRVYKMNETVDLVKGTYYFAVVKSDEEYTGNYNFKLIYTSAKESISESQSHSNNSISEADKIKINKSYKGQIAANDDTDLYKITFKTRCTVKLKVNAYIWYSSYYMYDSNGNEVWSKTWQEWNETKKEYKMNETLTLPKGKYYFAVSRDSDYTGNYTFSIECVHKYKTKSTSKATFSKTGKTVKKCSDCGKTTTTKIQKIKSVKLSKTKYSYNGKTRKPSVKIKNAKGKTLKKGVDYTVKYSKGCKKPGKYRVTIKFKGKYSGTKKMYFKIVRK